MQLLFASPILRYILLKNIRMGASIFCVITAQKVSQNCSSFFGFVSSGMKYNFFIKYKLTFNSNNIKFLGCFFFLKYTGLSVHRQLEQGDNFNKKRSKTSLYMCGVHILAYAFHVCAFERVQIQSTHPLYSPNVHKRTKRIKSYKRHAH